MTSLHELRFYEHGRYSAWCAKDCKLVHAEDSTLIHSRLQSSPASKTGKAAVSCAARFELPRGRSSLWHTVGTQGMLRGIVVVPTQNPMIPYWSSGHDDWPLTFSLSKLLIKLSLDSITDCTYYRHSVWYFSTQMEVAQVQFALCSRPLSPPPVSTPLYSGGWATSF